MNLTNLKATLKKNFLYPLVISFITSIMIIIIILIFYLKLLKNPKSNIIREIDELNSKSTQIYLEEVESYIFFQFQKGITTLQILKEHIKAMDAKYTETDDLYKKVENIFINGKETEEINDIYSFIIWWIDNIKIEKGDLDKKVKKYQVIFSHLIPIMKSIVSVKFENNENFINNIFMIVNSQNYFQIYPSFTNVNLNSDFDNQFCLDEDFQKRNYFYYKCREWYSLAKRTFSEEKSEDEILITNTYKSANESNQSINKVVTLCAKLNKENDLNYLNYLNDLVLICIDMNLNQIVTSLEDYNNKIEGYFYLLNKNNPYPIYYPYFDIETIGDISFYEFGKDEKFYLNEVQAFWNIMRNLTSTTGIEMSKRDFSTLFNENIEYLKMEETYKIKIINIFFKTNIKNSIPVHLLNLIYIVVKNKQSSIDSIYQFQFYKVIFQIILLIIFCTILSLITLFRSNFLSQKINKPIEVLKSFIQGINEKNFIQKKNFDEGSDDDESEDDFDINSIDLKGLFNDILKLKKCLTISSNKNILHENSEIFSFLNCKNIFNEVKNTRGLAVAESNLGNIFLMGQKYDKAIIHLVRTIGNEELTMKSLMSLKDNEYEDIKVFVDKLKERMKIYIPDKEDNNNINRKKSPEKPMFSPGRRKESIKNVRQGNRKIPLNNRKSSKIGFRFSSPIRKKGSKVRFINNQDSNVHELLQSPVRNKLKTSYEAKSAVDDNNDGQYVEIRRYSKLLFAYKSFFSLVNQINKLDSTDSTQASQLKKMNKLSKCDEYKVSVDYFVDSNSHSIEEYEKYLKRYIIICLENERTIRLAEGILEYIEFIIEYRLKQGFLNRNQNQIYDDKVQDENENVNINEEKIRSISSPAEKEKKITSTSFLAVKEKEKENKKILSYSNMIKSVNFLFQEFDKIYKILKKGINSQFYSNLVDMLMSIKENPNKLIFPPFLILKQRSIYLKGLFSMYCGDMKSGIENFLESRKIKIISDASIIKKSMQNLKQIITDFQYKVEMRKRRIEYEYEEIRMSNQIKYTTKNDEMMSKIEDQKRKYEDYIDKSKGIINDIDNDIQKFFMINREYICIIDNTSTMKDDMKNKKAVEFCRSLFQRLVNINDKYCLMLNSNKLLSIIKLTEKNEYSYEFILQEHENLINSINDYPSSQYENISNISNPYYQHVTDQNGGFHKIIYSINWYINNSCKHSSQKWVLLFTDLYLFSKEDMSCFGILNQNKEKIGEVNLILIGFGFENMKNIEFINESLKVVSKNSGYYDINESIESLFDRVKCFGDTTDTFIYPNELYEVNI